MGSEREGGDRIPLREQVRVRFGLELRAVVVLALLGAVGVALALGIVVRGRPAELTPVGSSPSAATSPPSASPSVSDPIGTPTTSDDVIVVDVVGAVARPGVVRLQVGSRVLDAISATGGVLPGSTTVGLNLARRLTDGEQIAIGVPAATAMPTSAGTSTGSTSAVGPLDLNLATAAELETLPGVGPVLAGRIVEWRERNGRFASIEELNEVSGIGEATYAELAPLLRV